MTTGWAKSTDRRNLVGWVAYSVRPDVIPAGGLDLVSGPGLEDPAWAWCGPTVPEVRQEHVMSMMAGFDAPGHLEAALAAGKEPASYSNATWQPLEGPP